MIGLTQRSDGLRSVTLTGVVLCMGIVLLAVFPVDAGVTTRVSVDSAGTQANDQQFFFRPECRWALRGLYVLRL